MSNQPTQEQTRWFHLEPTDAWFFRDGRPSNLGEDQSDLQSLFPPFPTTVVGAIRAALAREHGWTGSGDWPQSIKDVLGDGDDLASLRFSGPFLAREQDGKDDPELLFPMPGHVIGRSIVGENDTHSHFEACDWLIPSPEPIVCDCGSVRLPIPKAARESQADPSRKPPTSTSDFFVTATGLTQILKGTLPELAQTIHRDELFVLEPRIGIRRDEKTKTTLERALYSPQYVRLRAGVSLVVGISGLPNNWPVPSLFPLGGESRLAGCEVIESLKLPSSANQSDASLIVLLTPALFSTHYWWGAGFGDQASQLSGELTGEVVSVAVDRRLRIGGWNSVTRGTATRGPLPLIPAVSPGAVWWLDEPRQSLSEFVDIGDRNSWGYGLAVAANLPK